MIVLSIWNVPYLYSCNIYFSSDAYVFEFLHAISLLCQHKTQHKLANPTSYPLGILIWSSCEVEDIAPNIKYVIFVDTNEVIYICYVQFFLSKCSLWISSYWILLMGLSREHVSNAMGISISHGLLEAHNLYFELACRCSWQKQNYFMNEYTVWANNPINSCLFSLFLVWKGAK